MRRNHDNPRTIQLFAGIGGGVYADLLLGHRPVLYVERNPFRQRVIQRRIADGIFPDAPIWSDIRELPDMRIFRGRVDIISGGYPCQFASSAARGRNVADNLWPEMRRIVSQCRPPHVFAENVTLEAIEPAAQDLYELGYTCAYIRLSTADLGGTHRRNRFWLLGCSDPEGEPRRPLHAKMEVVPVLPGLAWEQDVSRALGVDTGLPDRRLRLAALGDSQVPVLAAAAYRTLESILIAQ